MILRTIRRLWGSRAEAQERRPTHAELEILARYQTSTVQRALHERAIATAPRDLDLDRWAACPSCPALPGERCTFPWRGARRTVAMGTLHARRQKATPTSQERSSVDRHRANGGRPA